MEKKIPTELGIELPLSTIKYQAEQYRKLVKIISAMSARLNINEFTEEKRLQAIENKIAMYSKAEKDLIKYIDSYAPDAYPEEPTARAENYFAGDLIYRLEDDSSAVAKIVGNILDQFYAWRI